MVNLLVSNRAVILQNVVIDGACSVDKLLDNRLYAMFCKLSSFTRLQANKRTHTKISLS